MIRPLLGAALALLLPFDALAQTVPADEQAPALEPFVASYEVYNGGRRLGEASLQVVRDAPRWRIDLNMRGSGLFKIAGIKAEQSTVFDLDGAAYRPLSQSTVRRTLFTRKQSTGVYDWASRSAQWRGDVKASRARPVPLQAGDMSGLLINLAVIRDAEPGRTLAYRFVDAGRTRLHRYLVAAEPERVAIGDLSYSAMRVARIADPAADEADEETVIWIARGVPTPVRMLQRENGEDTYDLRLVEYTGAQR